MYSDATRRRALALYDAGFSVRGVAKRLEQQRKGAPTPQTIARWMRELGRSRHVGGPRTIKLPEHAKRLYDSGLSIEQVALRFNVGKTSTARCLRELGAAIRPSGSRFLHLLTEDRLKDLYVRNMRTMRNIATEAGCSLGTVHRLLRLYGIHRKSSSSRESPTQGHVGSLMEPSSHS